MLNSGQYSGHFSHYSNYIGTKATLAAETTVVQTAQNSTYSDAKSHNTSRSRYCLLLSVFMLYNIFMFLFGAELL